MLHALQILPLALYALIGLHLRHRLGPLEAIAVILLNEVGKDQGIGTLAAIFRQHAENQIDGYVDSYIKIADTNLITGVVDGNDNNRLIGFGVSFPSLTDALQKIGNGKLMPWGWWQIVKALKLHKTDTVDLVLIGVLPEYRSKGANALIFADLIEQYHRYGTSGLGCSTPSCASRLPSPAAITANLILFFFFIQVWHVFGTCFIQVWHVSNTC